MFTKIFSLIYAEGLLGAAPYLDTIGTIFLIIIPTIILLIAITTLVISILRYRITRQILKKISEKEHGNP